MKKASILFSIGVVLASMSLSAASKFKIEQLQGAWWSDFKSPTADFGIQGNQVWLDYDSEYHPCEIEDDILIFDLGPERGLVKNRIISVKGDHLVMEYLATKKEWSLTRVAK